MNELLLNYLEDKNITISKECSGIQIESQNDEIVISGKQIDLLELASYLISIALSNQDQDHIHLDDLSLISEGSQIRSLILEKK